MEFAGWKISLQIPSVEGEKKIEEIGFSATFLHRRLIRHRAKWFDERKKTKKGEERKKKERKLMEKYGDPPPPLRIGHRIILDLLMQFS